MKPLIVTSAADLLLTVKKFREEWKVPRRKELWFRAEDDKHKATTLQPKLFRPAENKPMKSVKRLLQIEDECHGEFWRCADQLCDSKLDGEAEWDWYFLSQHHGVPTRLLDWSDGALIALHFIVHRKIQPVKTGGTIYVLDPYWLMGHVKQAASYDAAKKNWSKYRKRRKGESLSQDDWDDTYLPTNASGRKELPLPDAPLVWDSPHVSRRIAAQRSRFMIFGSDPQYLSNLMTKSDSRLRAIAIPKENMLDIRYELRDAGVTESVVFPDLDGLGRELEQKWQDRIQD